MQHFLLNSHWRITADPNTTKKFLPQLFIGSSRPPMGTVLVTNEISPPTPPGWGLGGPESQKWAIWGANKNKLSWIIFINNEILDQKPKLLIMKSWSSEVASDFWSGSFLVRQAIKTSNFTGSPKQLNYFFHEFKLGFGVLRRLIATGASPWLSMTRLHGHLGGFWTTYFRAFFKIPIFLILSLLLPDLGLPLAYMNEKKFLDGFSDQKPTRSGQFLIRHWP